MDRTLIIQSSQNPKIKQIQKLRDKRDRDETHQFIIEGYRECLRAHEANWPFLQLFYSPELFLGTNEKALIGSISAEKYEVEPSLFRKISMRDRPDGIIAIAKTKHFSGNDLDHFLEGKKNPFLVIAEAIEKPGNLGSILRSADATGVDAVIVAERCTDVYNPNVVRSSVGTLFTVPVFELSNEEIYTAIQKYGIDLLAATPHTPHLYFDVDLRGPLALLVGTEQLGLSSFWMEKATKKIKLPMLGKADSLNVSNATTVLLYEVIRQRHHLS